MQRCCSLNVGHVCASQRDLDPDANGGHCTTSKKLGCVSAQACPDSSPRPRPLCPRLPCVTLTPRFSVVEGPGGGQYNTRVAVYRTRGTESSLTSTRGSRIAAEPTGPLPAQRTLDCCHLLVALPLRSPDRHVACMHVLRMPRMRLHVGLEQAFEDGLHVISPPMQCALHA